jgi:2-polyprenyl-3-methyl-5-hydroxy-6-metoxy-1,4-benzoquinol methylase
MSLRTSIASKESALRYDRSSDLTHEDSLSQLARRVPVGATVLDLGAATGALGRYLTEQRGCTVDGIERDPDAARIARPAYRTLLQLDLEHAVLADHLGERYDVIVCADVVEHLREPAALLRQLPALLAGDGHVLLSVPNVRYVGVVADLLGGEFRYRERGLLDRTHLRFFTRATLVSLLRETGFAIHELATLAAQPQETEFHDAGLDTLPPAVVRALLTEPDALTYQFIVDAVPGTRGDAIDLISATSPATLYFGLQLYWRGDGEPFDEARSVTARGVLGDDRQTIRFVIPPLAGAPAGLRLDVADRPGFVRLHALRLADTAGAELWRWDGDPAVFAASERHDLALLDGPLGRCWLSRGTDAFIELPVPRPALAGLHAGGSLSVDMGWPLSADFVLAGRLLDDHEARWDLEREELRGRADRLEQHVRERVGGMLERLDAAHAEARDLREGQNQLRSELDRLTVRNRNVERLSEILAARLWAIESTSPFERLTRTALRAILRRRVHLDVAGADATVPLATPRRHPPSGWVRLSLTLAGLLPSMPPPRFHLDVTDAFGQHTCLRVPTQHGRIDVVLALPRSTQDLRLVATDGLDTVCIEHVVMREIGRVEAFVRLAAPAVRGALSDRRRLGAGVRTLLAALRRGGVREVGRMLAEQRDPNGVVTR